jgi:hypothetical protein
MRAVLEAKRKWAAPWPASSAEHVQVVDLLGGEAEDDSGMDEVAPEHTSVAAAEITTAMGPAANLGQTEEVTVAAVDPSLLSNQVDNTRIADLADIRGAMLAAAQSLGDDLDASLDAHDVDAVGTSSGAPKVKHPATVQVPGHGSVYKMRLVSQLNATPHHVPLDRLRRVRVRSQDGTSEAADSTSDEVGLFDVVALWLEETANTHNWFIGKVQKMHRIGNRRGRTDYHLPVSLAALRDDKVFVVCKYYKEVDTSRTRFRYGGYEGEESDSIPLTAVIAVVNLMSEMIPSVEVESSVSSSRFYTLDPADKRLLDDFLAKETSRRVARVRPTRSDGETDGGAGASSAPVHATRQSLLAITRSEDGTPALVTHTTRFGRNATRLAQQ